MHKEQQDETKVEAERKQKKKKLFGRERKARVIKPCSM